MTKEKTFSLGYLFIFYYLVMQFCLPLFLLHSIHMLTRLFCVNSLGKDCESKSNLSAFFFKRELEHGFKIMN